ncbi:MAG: hypothetical protein R6V10_00520 [bacterium]
MKTSSLLKVKLAVMIAALSLASSAYGQSKEELCSVTHRKPDLSTQQIKHAEFVHYLVVISGLPAPSPEGKSTEEYYQQELSLLVDAGYPPALKQMEADRIVTRRYFASIIFQIAKQTDPAFATRYSDCKDEHCKINALVESGWMHSKTGNIYREEILSVLCSKDIRIKREGVAIDIEPILLMGAELEAPASPI